MMRSSTSRRLVITLFRSFLRQAVALEGPLIIQSIPSSVQFNHFEFYDPIANRRHAAPKLCDGFFLHKLDFSSHAIDRKRLRHIISEHFATYRTLPSHMVNEATSAAFTKLRYFCDLQRHNLRSCSALTTVDDCSVRISCSTIFGGHIVDPNSQQSLYVYHYRIQIENCSTDSGSRVQLFGRHWNFENCFDRVENTVPKYANGVIGETPVLCPQMGFEYTSNCFLTTEVNC
jgi:uncharacterized protein affecting Mg2+/Co2+ transport